MSTTSFDDLPPLPTHITDEQRLNVMKAVTDELQTQEAKGKLVDDIIECTKRVNALRANFRDTHSKLLLLDDDEFLKKKDYSFAEKWQELYDKFVVVLDDSLFSASDIGDFENLILSTLNNKEKTDEEKKAVLRDFIQRVEGYSGEAIRVRNEFSKVADAVSDFYVIYNTHFDKVLDILEGDIKATQKKIQSAQTAIKSIKEKLVAFGIVTGVLLITFIALTYIPGFGAIAAAAAATTLKIGASVIYDHVKKLKEAQAELEKQQGILADLKKKVQLVQECGKAIGGAEDDNSLLATAAGFANVWKQVIDKCNLFENDLKETEKDLDVKLHLEKGRTYWGDLGDAMIKYAELQTYVLVQDEVPVKKTVSPEFTTWVNSNPAVMKAIAALPKVHSLRVTASV